MTPAELTSFVLRERAAHEEEASLTDLLSIQALVNRSQYDAAYPSVDANFAGDVDGSGTFDAGDIKAFSELFGPPASASTLASASAAASTSASAMAEQPVGDVALTTTQTVGMMTIVAGNTALTDAAIMFRFGPDIVEEPGGTIVVNRDLVEWVRKGELDARSLDLPAS